jgi:hypothetical protein
MCKVYSKEEGGTYKCNLLSVKVDRSPLYFEELTLYEGAWYMILYVTVPYRR